MNPSFAKILKACNKNYYTPSLKYKLTHIQIQK